VVIQSRIPGYYPKQIRELARIQAMQAPYPTQEILCASLLITVAMIATYYIAARFKNSPAYSVIFAFAFTVVHSAVTPTDTGGVQYAIVQYATCTFIISLLFAVAFYASKFSNLGSKP
jgi:hypothetical protein